MQALIIHKLSLKITSLILATFLLGKKASRSKAKFSLRIYQNKSFKLIQIFKITKICSLILHQDKALFLSTITKRICLAFLLLGFKIKKIFNKSLLNLFLTVFIRNDWRSKQMDWKSRLTLLIVLIKRLILQMCFLIEQRVNKSLLLITHADKLSFLLMLRIR